MLINQKKKSGEQYTMFHKCFFNSLVVLKNSISEIFYHNMPDSNLRLVQNLVSEVMRQILCKLLTIIQESWYSNGKNHIPQRNVALFILKQAKGQLISKENFNVFF